MLSAQYVAGFVDGEGSLSLSRGGCYRAKGKQRVPTYRPMLAISNNKVEILRLIKTFFGAGTVHVHKEAQGNRRQSYVFMLVGHAQMLLALPKLIPHLVLKKRQAEIILEFSRRRLEMRTRRLDGSDYAYVLRVRKLNGRHPGKGTPIMPFPASRGPVQQHKLWKVR